VVDRVGIANLTHAIRNDCTDPDCEIHHPDVGIAEETVNLTNLAFYVAGALRGMQALEVVLGEVIAREPNP